MLFNSPESDDNQKEHLQMRSIRARNIKGEIQFLKCTKCDLYFYAEGASSLHDEVEHNKIALIVSLRFS